MGAIKASGYKILELYAPECLVPFLIDFKREHKEKPVRLIKIWGIMPEVGNLQETKPGFVIVDDNI